MKDLTKQNYINEQHISSLEIAELTGKMHKDVMKAIRMMEPGWVNACGRKFALTSKSVGMPNGGTREVPCYLLTKLESLYVITKFNNEARARLVMRWAELEEKEHRAMLDELEEHRECLEYYREVMTSEDTVTVRQMAFPLKMTAQELNKLLCTHGIQYGQSGSYIPKAEYARRGFCKSRTYHKHGKDGEIMTMHRTTWTEKGIHFVVDFVKNMRRRAKPKINVVQLFFDF